jgi:branched-subunit amino acid ABC-type transport system permease component
LSQADGAPGTRTAGVRRLAPLVAILFAAMVALLTFVSPAPAIAGTGGPAPHQVIDPDTANETIAVWIRQASDKAGIEGVRVTIEGPDFSAEVVTDADGRAYVGLPGPGTYTVAVDGETVPAEAGRVPDASNPRDIRVSATNTNVPANFLATTEAGGGPAPTAEPGSTATPAPESGGQTGAGSPTRIWNSILAKVVLGLIFGLLLALASIGVSLIYGTTGLNNFAHGELVTFGALIGFFFTSLGWPGPAAILGAVVAGGIFGYVQDLGIWKPLRRRRVGLIPLMIVSIGLAIALRYSFVLIFGPNRLVLPNNTAPFVVLGPVSLRFTDVAGAVISIVVLLLVAFVMLRTKLGKAARAVSDNRALAAASGIDVDRVIRYIWIGGAALAALAGVLLGYYQSLRWDLGSSILLLIFAAVTLGGLGSAFGALVGSLALSILINLSTVIIPENLKYAAALVLLILILLFRPQGILGRRERVG